MMNKMFYWVKLPLQTTQ